MNKRLPLGLLAILLIVLLAGVGVAYGLWSETLTISGTVNTGEVDVGLSGPLVYEWVEVNDKPQLEPKEKDPYAECFAVASDTDPSDGMETITVTVTGAYPSYHCMVKFDVSNLGTVPVHISKVTPMGEVPAWIKATSCYPEWKQIHRGESAWASLLIHFTNNDGVLENKPYTFKFKVDALQWNEAPPTSMLAVQEACDILPDLDFE